MRTPETNWERLVRAALRRERLGVVVSEQQPVSGVAGNVPSSLTNNTHIDEILRAADEIEDEDPNIARILCEHAYSLAQNLDPNSEGRGVLQFKTGLMSVIKQKLAKRDGRTIDRSQDIARLQEFYKHYREKNKVDELREDEMKMRESGVLSGNLGELEKKTLKRKKVFATLRVLGTVLEELTREMAPDATENLISEEMKRVMEKDAAMTEDVIPYNIIPLDTPSITNAIVNLPEVKAAILSLKYYANLPQLPSDFPLPAARSADVLDLLRYVFGFQMARELEEILHQPIAQSTKSCISPDGVSFLSQVIFPLYDVIAAEAANNDNGRAPYSAWRNYDDFNEFFWSLRCFQLGWPWKLSSPFFSKPSKNTMGILSSGGSWHYGKTSFVEHRTFLHLYHSFHRLWIFLFMMFQGLTIIAFNNGVNSTTIKQVLSLGPTYVVMKFIESVLYILMMYGAFSTSRRSAVT